MTDEPLRIGPALYWEVVLGTKCEVDIEAELLSAMQRTGEQDRFSRKLIASLKYALKRHDELLAEGRLETERERLRKKHEDVTRALRFPRIDADFAAALKNLLCGLRSPDAEQRERFQKFYDAAELGDKIPGDAADLIVALEQAKKPRGGKGKPVTPPWRNCAAELDAMRLMIAREGCSVPEAARRAASNQTKAVVQNRAKYLAEHYEGRRALR